MRGEVLSYDTTAGAGLISGDDGVRYSFVSSALQSPAVPAPGVRVDFVPEGEQATQILILAGAASTVGVAGGYASGGPDIPSTIAGFDWKQLLFSFNGRIRRSHFWIAWLIVLGVNVVISWIPIINLLGFLLIWPFTAIAVKRLHDMGRPAWFVAIPWIASILLTTIGFMMIGMSVFAAGGGHYDAAPGAFFALMGPGLGAFLLSGVLWLGFLLWIGLVEGQPGDNAYGPSPKGL